MRKEATMHVTIHKSHSDVFTQELSKALAELIAALDGAPAPTASPPENKGGDAA